VFWRESRFERTAFESEISDIVHSLSRSVRYYEASS
jgi:hypothetical protein